MKVIAINGSPRTNSNTLYALNIMGEVFSRNNIELEILNIAKDEIRGCMACNACGKMQNRTCIINDRVNEDIKKLQDADGIILASPTYFAGVNGTMKSYLDRLFYVCTANGNFFRHKVGGAITISRRDGGMTALDTLNYFLQYSEMLLASSNYWSSGYGRVGGELEKDNEGVQIFRVLAENMVYLLKMREATKDSVIPVPRENKEFCSFIR